MLFPKKIVMQLVISTIIVSLSSPVVYADENVNTGIRAVQIYNCTVDKVPVKIWTMDMTNGTGWQQRGSLEGQYQGASCPGNSLPLVLPLQHDHVYRIVAVAPSRCEGRNDPNYSLCQVSAVAIQGDQIGPIYNMNLAGNGWITN